MLSPARCFPPLRTMHWHVRLASTSRSTTARPGRNLTERYRRLEKRIRGKSALSKQVSVLSQGSASAAELQPVHLPVTPSTLTPSNTIAGFAIPEEPRPPADDECCMSGCAICVYDLYEESLAAYKESVTTLRSALSALHIPESQWPAHIRSTRETGAPATTASSNKTKGAVLSAFEEMERALEEKREKRAAVEAEKRARGEVLEGDGEKVGLDLRVLYEGLRWMVFPNR